MPMRRRTAIRPEPGVPGPARRAGREDQAVHWYRKAAGAGNVAAMVSLGALLRKQGREDQAVHWYRKAADAGRRDR